jgi:hypothetical protein
MVAPRQRERINSPHELKRKLESSALRAIGVAGETAQAGDSHNEPYAKLQECFVYELGVAIDPN